MTTTTLFPDATTTGVPAGTQLVAATSNEITKPGVYSGLVFTGTVQIECSGVTLENCVVKDTPSDWTGVLVSGNVQNVVIQNCEVAGASSSSTVTGTYGIYVQDDAQVSILNNNIHDVGSPFVVGGGQVVIEGNYAHDFYSGPGTHYNGIQVNGVPDADFSLVMQHNTIINNQQQTDAVMLDNQFGAIHNVTITNNLLVGGDYTVYVDASKGSYPVTNVNISNNHLGAGIYGEWYTDSGSLSSANYQVTTSGNVDDGTALAAALNTAANQTTGTGSGSTTGSTSSSSSPPPDTVAPAAPVIAKDTVVNSTVQVSGTAEAGATIKLYDGSTLVGTAHAASSGAWSLTTSALTQGTHALTASATDAAGNTSVLSKAVDPVIAPAAPVIAKDTVVNNTVQVSGTAEAGSTIKLYDGSTLVGTTQTASNGAWSLTASALTAGTHALTASATDTTGNTSALSKAVDPVIATSSPPPDTVAPNAPVITADTVVNNTVQVSGTAEAGATVKVYDGSTLVGSAHAASNGAWSVTTSALTQGTHALTASATDAAGNTSHLSQAVDPVIDTVAPGAPVIAKDTVVNNTVQLSGTAEAGATVKVYDGSTLVGSAHAASNGAWSVTTSALTQGTHALTASATDAAGNTSHLSQAVDPVIDTVAPGAPVIAKDTVVNNTVQVSGTAEAGATVKVYDGSTLVGSAHAASNGAWSVTTSALTQGTHALTASATDAAGNTSHLSQAVDPVIDTVAPGAPVIAKDTVVNNTVQLSGTAEAGATVKVYDGSTLVGSAHAASNGAWSLTTSALTQGTHALTASATDAAGNTSHLSQAVDPVIDTVAPGAPVIAKDTVVNSTVQLSGTAEADSTIKLYDGTTLLGTTHAAADGDWSVTTSALTQGTHALAATATDAAGNTSHLSQAVDPVIGSASSGHHSSSPPPDTAAPDAPVIRADTVVHHTVQMSGTAEADSTIKLYDGATLLGTTHAASDGDWSFTTPALSRGAHTLAASSTDAAGNTSALSEAVDPVIGSRSSDGGSTSTHNHLTGSSETLLQFTGVQQNHDHTVTLTGTADSGTPLNIYDGTKDVGSVTTDTDGNWSFRTSAAPNHVHSYTAALIDKTGDTVATTTGAVVVGTNSGEKLLSTSGDDILAGKAGADTFVFAPNFGHDSITNFKAQGAQHDTIDFSSSVFDNFASVLAHASQDGHNVVISAGSDTLTLKNMKLGALNSHDFHFG